MSDKNEFDTDVVVIGTGPAGSTLGLALASYGIRVNLFSQFNWLANSPRAHITNQRAMEVLRDLGIESQVHEIATPWDLMGDSLITTSLAGEEIARIRSWGTGEERKSDYLTGSPCPLVDLIQPKMEKLLVTNAAERGAVYNFNTEYISHTQDESGVTVKLKNLLNGNFFEVRAKYLIGMDGARSKIVEQLNLPLEGELARAGTVYVNFKADLSKYVTHRPSILNWIVNPQAGFGEIGMGLLRAIEPWDQWIAGWGFDISQGEPKYTNEEILNRIKQFIGEEDVEIEILKVSTWYVNQLYAKEYSLGRVFCGGDAVHRHPPSSGLGSNTCIQDAFNLAWKLAFVIKNWANTVILDSYTFERAPIGKQIVERANQSRFDYRHLKEVFGFDQGISNQDKLLSHIFSCDKSSAAIRAKLFEALNIKNYEFNAQGIELNQRYYSNAVINEKLDEHFFKDPSLYLNETTRPGSKIPHAWLIDSKGYKFSTLDAVGKGKFTVITGLSGQAWIDAARAINKSYIRCVQIGSKEFRDIYGSWFKKSQIHDSGILLVRPDGYIAWRQFDIDSCISPKETLNAVISKLNLK